MKYSELTPLLEDKAGLTLLDKMLSYPARNKEIDMLRDYYDGYQWKLGRGVGIETRMTRSGVEMWKAFDSKDRARGFTEGELKVWNIGKPAIDVYKRYTRGVDSDDVKVVTSIGDDEVEEVEGLDIFGDLNEFTMDGTERMSIDSVVVTKFNASKEDSVLSAIANTMGEPIKKVEIIDPKTIEPLYWRGVVRGYLRFYKTTWEAVKEIVDIDLSVATPKKEALYIEVWHITDNGKVEIIKIFDRNEIERGFYEFDFLPYYIEGNSESCIDKFDLRHIEYSDIGDLITLQDDLNKHLTTVTKIFDTVAFPILTLDPQFWEITKGNSLGDIKKQIESVSLIPGGITTLPLNRLPADGISNTQDAFIDRILTQFYMTTGIPKSIFNSEGLSNTSGAAMTVMTESLRRKVADKRTRMAKIIKHNVRLWKLSLGETVDSIEVNFPDMVEITAEDRIRILESASSGGLLPKDYVTKSVLELLGDEEDSDDIVGNMIEQDAKAKADIESAILRSSEAKAKEAERKRAEEIASLEAQMKTL